MIELNQRKHFVAKVNMRKSYGFRRIIFAPGDT